MTWVVLVNHTCLKGYTPDVFGPFNSEDEAIQWAREQAEAHSPNLSFHISQIIDKDNL